MLGLIDELEFKKIHLVGFSLGALIAREFASIHNDRLCSLILHGSIYKRTEDQKRVVINRWNVAKLNRLASKKAALRRWFTEDFTKKNPEIYKKIYSLLEKNDNKNFLKIILTLSAHSILQRCFPFLISTNLLPSITLLKFFAI